jgi:hypothetical protein
MSCNQETALILASGAIFLTAYIIKRKQRKPRRRWWRCELYKQRTGSELLRELKFQHIGGQYKNFSRMSPTDFETLLNKIGPKISKKETHFRRPVSIQDRLVYTIQYYVSINIELLLLLLLIIIK